MLRKIIKTTVIVIASLLLLLIVLPVAFKGQIVERVKYEINQNVNADVDFGTFRISLIRNFPNVSLRVNEVKVVGVDEFDGVPLADIGSFFVSIDLMSLIRGNGYEINTIRLDDPKLNFKILTDGTANWDIAIVEEDAPERPEDAEPAAFQLTLQRIQIRNGHILYHDDYATTYITADNLNATMRGDLTQDLTTISTRNATIGAFSLRYDKMPILSRVAVNLTATLDADLNNFMFTFRDNRLRLNELPVRFDGLFGMPEEGMLMDFTFGAEQSEFRHFLSLVPAVYAKDFESLQTSGTLQLDGFVNGMFTEDEIPGFGLNLAVENGRFQYPDLPGAVTGVQIGGSIVNPGVDTDLTVVDVPVFKMNFAGNPVDARFNLKTPVSDPQVDAALTGRIDLSQVENFYPLDPGESLSGIITSNLEARGRLSSIEAGRYREFHAGGRLQVQELDYVSEALPLGVKIKTADFRFRPERMSLDAFESSFGESDLNATGSIDNLLGYLFDGQLLRGSFETRSAFLNLNQLMEQIPEDETPSDEPMQLSVIKIPENIDFSLRSRVQNLVFGEMEISGVNGRLRIGEQQAVMDNLRMNLLGGNLVLNGSYDTREELPEVNFGLNINGFNIQETFNTFNTLQVLAPIGRYATGSFSSTLQLNSVLDENLEPLLETLSGQGSFRSSSVVVENSPAMVKLADQLRLDLFREIPVRDLSLSFRFADGKVDVDPFDIRFGQSRAEIAGSSYFDQRIDYVMQVQIPREQFGTQANQVLNNLVGRAADRGVTITPGETVNLDVKIEGTFTDPEVSFHLAGMMDDVGEQLKGEVDRLIRDAEDRVREEVDRVRDEVEERVEETIDDARERAQEELDRRADQVIQQAEQRAEQIRREGKRAADAIRQEARDQAKKLEDEASGPIAKAAARRTGEALIREADRRADQVEAEAEANAQRIIDEAKAQADRIRAGEE